MAYTDAASPLLPDRAYLKELLRPWKLTTFTASMVWLVYGGLVYGISDWDVGISFIMGGLTYLCAPWSIELLFRAARQRPANWLLQVAASLLPAILTVDSFYWLYHTLVGNRMLRWENFTVSMPLYFICGLGWYYRGSLKQALANTRDVLTRQPPSPQP